MIEIFDPLSPVGRSCAKIFEEVEVDIPVYICNPPPSQGTAIEDCGYDEFINNIEKSIADPFFAVQKAASRMKNQNGRLIFIGSIHAEKPAGAFLHSCAAGALKNFSRECAVRWGGDGIISVFIEAGPVNGEKFETALYADTRYRAPAYSDFTPGAVARIALSCALAPDMINGAEIKYDGGLTQNYLDHSANWRKHLDRGGDL